MSVQTSNHSLWLWPLLAAIAAIGFAEIRYRQLVQELQARPPVAVIPVDDVVVEKLRANPGVDAQAEIIRVRQAGERLAESGYIVLDARTVYAYPTDLEARP